VLRAAGSPADLAQGGRQQAGPDAPAAPAQDLETIGKWQQSANQAANEFKTTINL